MADSMVVAQHASAWPARRAHREMQKSRVSVLQAEVNELRSKVSKLEMLLEHDLLSDIRTLISLAKANSEWETPEDHYEIVYDDKPPGLFDVYDPEDVIDNSMEEVSVEDATVPAYAGAVVFDISSLSDEPQVVPPSAWTFSGLGLPMVRSATISRMRLLL